MATCNSDLDPREPIRGLASVAHALCDLMDAPSSSLGMSP